MRGFIMFGAHNSRLMWSFSVDPAACDKRNVWCANTSVVPVLTLLRRRQQATSFNNIWILSSLLPGC